MGGTAFDAESIEVMPLDDLHAMAHAHWRFDYQKDGRDGTIRFANIYLVAAKDGPRLFDWITPDEQVALREHGLA